MTASHRTIFGDSEKALMINVLVCVFEHGWVFIDYVRKKTGYIIWKKVVLKERETESTKQNSLYLAFVVVCSHKWQWTLEICRHISQLPGNSYQKQVLPFLDIAFPFLSLLPMSAVGFEIVLNYLVLERNCRIVLY